MFLSSFPFSRLFLSTPLAFVHPPRQLRRRERKLKGPRTVLNLSGPDWMGAQRRGGGGIWREHGLGWLVTLSVDLEAVVMGHLHAHGYVRIIPGRKSILSSMPRSWTFEDVLTCRITGQVTVCKAEGKEQKPLVTSTTFFSVAQCKSGNHSCVTNVDTIRIAKQNVFLSFKAFSEERTSLLYLGSHLIQSKRSLGPSPSEPRPPPLQPKGHICTCLNANKAQYAKKAVCPVVAS